MTARRPRREWRKIDAFSASTAAVAQVIPPSELPGRERERFTTYPVTPFQPGAPIAGLPSAQPPPARGGCGFGLLLLRQLGGRPGTFELESID
jgi:hypothetical protein